MLVTNLIKTTSSAPGELTVRAQGSLVSFGSPHFFN